jgi:hypothetical protein
MGLRSTTKVSVSGRDECLRSEEVGAPLWRDLVGRRDDSRRLADG